MLTICLIYIFLYTGSKYMLWNDAFYHFHMFMFTEMYMIVDIQAERG